MEGDFQFVSSDEPNDLVTADFLGPLPRARGGGVQYLLVMVDAFSKLVRMYAIKAATTGASLKRIFDDYIPECGKFKRILTDNGTQHTSHMWKNKFESEGIRVL